MIAIAQNPIGSIVPNPSPHLLVAPLLVTRLCLVMQIGDTLPPLLWKLTREKTVGDA
ncbi:MULTISPECIES: hypothetical protein [Microcoleaceae]|uniref:hypothetical protein n=1 Tax=Microcoleaceae TaxID=1892252 RepID=UPI00187E5D5E|nr:hypothetical protein [Tychonema sp. LEGE 06208]MBE9162267.1 hypothetical protein [Tychonema sp. LEGE 06208]